MREIKFRGKSLEGQWVYGDLTRSLSRNGGYNHFIHTVTEDLDETIEHHLVDATTVGQYTGYPDKNNTEIYDGDIILIETGHKEIVSWDPVYAAWVVGEEEMLYELNFARDQIIGNIHDNPELLNTPLAEAQSRRGGE